MYFRSLALRKTWLEKTCSLYVNMLKCHEHAKVNMLKCHEHCCNLQDNTFINFLLYSEGSCIGKCLPKSHLKS